MQLLLLLLGKMSRNYLKCGKGWGRREGKLHVVSNHTHRGTAFKSNQNGNAFPTKRRALSKCSIFSNLIAGATTTLTTTTAAATKSANAKTRTSTKQRMAQKQFQGHWHSSSEKSESGMERESERERRQAWRAFECILKELGCCDKPCSCLTLPPSHSLSVARTCSPSLSLSLSLSLPASSCLDSNKCTKCKCLGFLQLQSIYTHMETCTNMHSHAQTCTSSKSQYKYTHT